jgi:hypothetical protein
MKELNSDPIGNEESAWTFSMVSALLQANDCQLVPDPVSECSSTCRILSRRWQTETLRSARGRFKNFRFIARGYVYVDGTCYGAMVPILRVSRRHGRLQICLISGANLSPGGNRPSVKQGLRDHEKTPC